VEVIIHDDENVERALKRKYAAAVRKNRRQRVQ
jgi:hypothetical protein